MRKIVNIRLKNIDKARAHSIFVFKKEFGISLVDSKELTKRILESGGIEATYLGFEWGRHNYEYTFNTLSNLSVEQFEGIMSNAFDYDIEKVDLPSNGNMREPCEATAKALTWRDSLSEEEQEMIKLIGDWENPAPFYGYAAVC